MANNATRRSLLKAATGVAAYGAGVAALSAGAAIVTADDAKGTTGGVSPDLTRLIAALHAATLHADRFTQEVWNPRLDRANAAYHALPHTAALNGSGMNPPIFTTENPQHIIRCRGIVSIPRSQQSQDPNWQVTYQAARKIAAADLRRQRALKRIYRETGMTEAEEMEERIYAAETKALDAVENFPAASLADMKAKLNVMVERERCEPVLVDMLTADLDRLTKREG